MDTAALVKLMRSEDARSYDSAAFSVLAENVLPSVRARTMMAAGRIGDQAALPLLIHGLSDTDESVRANAAFALGELADTSSAAIAALGALSATHGLAAAEALHALGKLAVPTARPYVEAALRTLKTGPELREALLAIWRFPRTPATSELVRPFTASPDVEVRWRAVYALARAGPDPANVPAFQQWAHDTDPLVRSLAVRGLRAAPSDSVNLRAQSAAVLLSLLGDADAHVRINALNVLGGYRDSTLAAQVTPLLADSDSNVRIAAAQALGLLKGANAAGALAGLVKDQNQKPAIRGAALASLISADPERGLNEVDDIASASDPLLRLYGARAFAAAHGPAAIERARRLTDDRDQRVAAAALSSVAAMAGDTLKAARALFIEKLAAADPYVRAEALAGLEHLANAGDEAIAFDAFERALKDDVEDAALAALGVLQKLAKDNPAVQRTFATRFPLDRIPLPSVQRAAFEKMHVAGPCCRSEAHDVDYQHVVERLLIPALLGDSLPRVRVNTAAGSRLFELLPADAPLTVHNFLSLVQRKYFDGSRWHRVVPNFVLQDGDPAGTGNGGPGYSIRDEINRVRYGRGAVGMALSGPDTGGSQFFVTHSPQPHLDGGYTVFGHVTSGMEVADRVVQDDPITSIEVIR